MVKDKKREISYKEIFWYARDHRLLRDHIKPSTPHNLSLLQNHSQVIISIQVSHTKMPSHSHYNSQSLSGSHQCHTSTYTTSTGGSYHKSSTASGGLSMLGSSKDQSNWRWNCCNCREGANNSYMFNSDCPMCSHARCTQCSFWGTE
ncbi:uncharacterized protein GGS25DRAFT_405801 [Hypoxylon fragiforme]|uniref:uncharacterized protein n=1 Tax=Hypoxylon fragiforme TaxID=63214 RepID=UPI0020C615C0|nr:uncharacterized protein GGS25DRAFT_405801 [Hypoxylon fragiforme]KAI2604950.1 hypothetical protein GGS25DRAFT_405801 [Hypoxylon fragiforme]